MEKIEKIIFRFFLKFLLCEFLMVAFGFSVCAVWFTKTVDVPQKQNKP
jgi:hypothetical protein